MSERPSESQEITGLMLKVAFAALRSDCNCEVCQLAKQLASVLEGRLTSNPRTKKGARVLPKE